MNKVYCNDLQPGTQIMITDDEGKKEEFTVRKYIPMQANPSSHIHDVEILLDKRKNTYFSYRNYIEGKSWAKEIEILS